MISGYHYFRKTPIYAFRGQDESTQLPQLFRMERKTHPKGNIWNLDHLYGKNRETQMILVLIGKDLVLEAKQRTNGFQVYWDHNTFPELPKFPKSMLHFNIFLDWLAFYTPNQLRPFVRHLLRKWPSIAHLLITKNQPDKFLTSFSVHFTGIQWLKNAIAESHHLQLLAAAFGVRLLAFLGPDMTRVLDICLTKVYVDPFWNLLPIGSMGLAYLSTWMVNLDGQCM